MKRFLAVIAAGLMVALSVPAAGVAATRPGNDDFNRAGTISALPFAERFNLRKAGVAADEPDCYAQRHSIWYSFTPSSDMRFFARVRKASFRGNVSVWTGSRGALTEVFCHRYQIPLVEATAGTTYYIRVAATRRVGKGTGTLVVREAPPPMELGTTVEPQGTIDSDTEEITISGTITCSQEDDVYVYGAVRQVGDDRRFITAWLDLYIEECEGTMPWTKTMFGDGVFVEGQASVELHASSCSRFECVQERSVQSIDLIRS